MIHSLFSITSFSLDEKLKQAQLSPVVRQALIILDEAALCCTIEFVRRYTVYHPGSGRALISITILEGGLIVGRTASLAMRLFGYPLSPLEKGINITKELATVLLFNLSYSHYWIHEQGHALAGHLCFKNAQPKVTIWPFVEGRTKVSVSYGLTSFGIAIGASAARSFLYLGGFGATTMWAMGEIALSGKMKKGGRLLLLHATAQIFQDMLYAVHYYWTSPRNQKHDLIKFTQASGIPAIVPIVAMVALPVIEILSMYAMNS